MVKNKAESMVMLSALFILNHDILFACPLRRRAFVSSHSGEDLDLGAGLLRVQRTATRATKGHYAFGQPKSAKGQRQVSLTRTLVGSLKLHRKRQLEARLKLDVPYTDLDLVFATPYGHPLHPNSVALRYNRLIARAGVPRLRFHDLRHTFATLMFANGEHPKVVQEILGHSDVGMTMNRFSHVTMNMQRQAADRLDALMTGT